MQVAKRNNFFFHSAYFLIYHTSVLHLNILPFLWFSEVNQFI